MMLLDLHLHNNTFLLNIYRECIDPVIMSLILNEGLSEQFSMLEE